MSKIKIYRTHLVPDRNALVDDLEYYLANECENTYTNDNFQYVQLGVDITGIKIPMPQSAITSQSVGNYVRIEQDGHVWYYFIIKANWRGQNTILLDLSIDSINTFRNDVEWSGKTMISREHQDRLIHLTGTTYFRRIDREDESIVPQKENLLDEYGSIADKIDNDWFLIYKTRDDLTVDNPGNPVECDLVADIPLLIKKGGDTLPAQTVYPNQFDNQYYYFDPVNNPNGSFEYKTEASVPLGQITLQDRRIYRIHNYGGRFQIELLIYEKDDGYYSFKSSSIINSSPVLYITFKQSSLLTVGGKINGWGDITQNPNVKIVSTGNQYDVATISINQIDKTDSRLMKIIRLPYAPDNFSFSWEGELQYDTTKWEFSNGMLKFKNLTDDFLNENFATVPITFMSINIPAIHGSIARNDFYESKFYNSNFFTFKLAYDNFCKDFKPEDWVFYGLESATADYAPSISVSFKPTNTINSKFAFKFAPVFEEIKGDNVGFRIRRDADYNNYLFATRNNEETIFSNDYLNYIRNGYNYDKKQHALEMTNAWIGFGAGVGGTAGSTIGAFHYANQEKNSALLRVAGFGGAISTGAKIITGIASNIINEVSYQNSMEGRLQQLSAQSTNVSGTDDIDLLKYYNKNRLNVITYETKDEDKALIADLFYFTGYAHNKQELPNTTSRYWFNFIQCRPVFKNEGTSPFNIYMDDIKLRYTKGVTVYHRHTGIIAGSSYDWDQTHENWETALVK